MAAIPDNLNVEPVRDRVAAMLRALKGHYRYTDDQIAVQIGMSRSAVQARMSGDTECSASDLHRFATFFKVPEQMFFESVEALYDPAARVRTGSNLTLAPPGEIQTSFDDLLTLPPRPELAVVASP